MPNRAADSGCVLLANGRRAVLALLGCALLGCASAPVGDAPERDGSPGCAAQASGCAQRPDGAKPGWMDSSYEYVTSRGDTLAQWMDSFFGAPFSDTEAADSVLRLLGEYEWDEDEGNDTKLRLRGKVDLPRLDRRLSLVFSEDDTDRRDVVPETGHPDSDIGLQVRVAERARSGLFVSVGTNASLEFRSSLRYRYAYPINEHWSTRFVERFYYTEDDQFGTLTRVDLDYSIDADHIVRWSADTDYGEETEGAEWGSRLGLVVRLSNKEAINYFGAIAGQTDPEHFTSAYALGVRYRRNVFRPWMFVEFEPSRVWRQDTPEEHLSSAWVVTLRVEFLEEEVNRHIGGVREKVREVIRGSAP